RELAEAAISGSPWLRRRTPELEGNASCLRAVCPPQPAREVLLRPSRQGFLRAREVSERTCSWLDRLRRCSKVDERIAHAGDAFTSFAVTLPVVARLTRDVHRNRPVQWEDRIEMPRMPPSLLYSQLGGEAPHPDGAAQRAGGQPRTIW